MELEEGKVSRPSIKKCPYCGEILPPLSNVCPSCGQIVEDSEGNSNATTMMSEIDEICKKYANTSIRFYDYVLLLIPLVYLVWIVVVIMKIVNSNKIYNSFNSLCSKARTTYGDNHRFRVFLDSKTSEIEELKRKGNVSHIIVYVLLFMDVVLLGFSLMS